MTMTWQVERIFDHPVLALRTLREVGIMLGHMKWMIRDVSMPFCSPQNWGN